MNNNLGKLIIYRNIAKDQLLLLYQAAIDDEKRWPDYCQILLERAVKEHICGDVFDAWLLDAIICDDNFFSHAAAVAPLNDLPATLLSIVADELNNLAGLDDKMPQAADQRWQSLLSKLPPTQSLNIDNSYYNSFRSNFAKTFHNRDGAAATRMLADFYYRCGYGAICRHNFFIWEDGLKGVDNSDPISFNQLFVYERQKQLIREHTKTFVAGGIINNLLLYGEKGTGKSSMIKAAANFFADQGLKLVAVDCRYWSSLGEILRILAGYRQRFIIFLDDFSFDADDNIYREIKTIIEGGVTAAPANTVIYASSNRRHLVSESWADRLQRSEDMYIGDTVAEKLSLAERFGITITFPPPTQDEYLNIVDGLAAAVGLEVESVILHAEAIKWERRYNSRSGRTAKQFITDMLNR